MADRYYDRDWDRNYYYGRDYYDPYYYDPYYYKHGYYEPFGYDRGYGTYPYYYDYWTYPYSYGQYSGYGPSGYTRSDELIRDDINDRLTWDGRIDATDVNVGVIDGIVTLTGSVATRREKRIAESIADSVAGVWDVNNQLSVRNRQSSANRDHVHSGMEVVDREGTHVGQVKDVRPNDFLVDRPSMQHVFVPFSACTVSGDLVRLNVLSNEVDDQGWLMPEASSAQRKR